MPQRFCAIRHREQARVIQDAVTGKTVPKMGFVAARDVLDRVLGRAPQAVNVDIELRKRFADMTLDELRAFRAKCVAAMMVAPALVEVTTTDISGPGDNHEG
jgi:2-methylaconitate cis-trans-isomerase PrpF